MDSRYIVAVALGLSLVGCAKLKVSKITPESRECGTDNHVKGFRYYLSRPYVVVSKPVLVSETAALYLLHPDKAMQAQALKMNPGSGTFETVEPAELSKLRDAVMVQNAQVQQASHRKPIAAPVQPTPEELPPLSQQVGILADAPGEADEALLADQARASQQGAASDSGSGSASHLNVPQATPANARTASLNGSIQVVFLPDLDEQYAVHNKNFLSKSAYSLTFRDGWALTDVSGEFDSTAVPIEILNFIETAITAAKSVALADVNRMARTLSDPMTREGARFAATEDKVLYRVVTSTYLQPGVYRVNKPWEIAEDTEVCGAGFLAKMGLATFEATRIEAYQTEASLADALALKLPCGCGGPGTPCP